MKEASEVQIILDFLSGIVSSHLYIMALSVHRADIYGLCI